jgi:hypothetical protein
VSIAQDFDACPTERVLDFIGTRPVVMISQHRDDGGGKASDDLDQLVEKQLTMTNEIAGQHHQVGMLCIRKIHGGALDGEGCDAADVEVRQMRDAQVRNLVAIGKRSGESTKTNTEAPFGLGCVPRIPLGGALRGPRSCNLQ